MNPKYEPQDESEANVSQADDVNHQSSPTAAATPVLFSSRYIFDIKQKRTRSSSSSSSSSNSSSSSLVRYLKEEVPV